MKLISARLGIETPHLLQGSAIDRRRPLQFKLDRRVISGFAGDTVLSAVLAAGIDTAGRRGGKDVALTSRHAPAIVASASRDDQHSALPMERALATDGAEYVTLAPRLKRDVLPQLLGRDRNSLHLDLDAADALTRPWLGIRGDTGPPADLVVIGGGVAGMSAALAGAKRGLRVVLLEATPRLGGNASLFGTLDGEEAPDRAIERLSQAVAKADKITLLTCAEAFALRPGVLRLHQVELREGVPTGRVLDIRAAHIILATGALERLPVFAGNRLPGVIGALEAFELAHHYGVWRGRSALIATSSSPAYRLAMLARDAGVEVLRILDSRPDPQSRFIEFSKAYGITQAAGTVAATVAASPTRNALIVTPQLALDELASVEAPLQAERLVASGGWQPDLTLWHMAGGESRWNPTSSRLEATGALPGITFAGSAAGWLSRSACLDSGSHAVDSLLGKSPKPVEDRLIDPVYETPDGAAPIGALPQEGGQSAFLDGGHGYLARPLLARQAGWRPFKPKPAGWSLAEVPQPLDIAAIAAGVQLGAIPADSAGIVAQERVAMVGIDVEDTSASETPLLPLPPPWLLGRYADAVLFVVDPVEQRRLTVGTLIHAGPDERDALKAIGVVVRIIEGTAIALVAGVEGQVASVREPGRSVAIRLGAAYSDGMDLGAALGGGASPL